MINLVNNFSYKIVFILAITAPALVLFLKNYSSKNYVNNIGFVLPIQNNALEKIKTGFCKEISKDYCVDCQNCMGDQIFQYNIIKNMLEKNYKFVVTIGSAAGVAAFSLCEKLKSKTQIIALAAKNIDTEFAKKALTLLSKMK